MSENANHLLENLDKYKITGRENCEESFQSDIHHTTKRVDLQHLQ